MHQEMTSEEKLLQLIRKKKKGAGILVKDDGRSGAVSLDVPENSSNPLAEKKQGIGWLKSGNRLMVAVTFGALAYGAWLYITIEQRSLPLPVDGRNKDSSVEMPATDPKKSSKDFDSYAQIFEERDVFQAPWENPEGEVVASAVASIQSDLIKQLTLVGIVLDKNPQAIIEDKKTRQTFFVRVGESVNGAVVTAIEEGKVIFKINEEKVELVQ